jgi:ABC-2 type transport system permease protein
MKVYFEIFKINSKILVFYRQGFYISIILNPLILVLYISLLNSIYANSPQKIILGYTCTQMIWYFAGISFFYLLVWCNNDKELSDSIISGDLALRLVKPMSLMKYEFAKTIAVKALGFVFEFIPICIIYVILVYPSFISCASILKYAIISLFAFLLYFFISFSIGITAFNSQSVNALLGLKGILINFAAGAFIPIEFFPKGLQSIIKMLPFQYILYVPIQFLLNKPETQNWEYFIKVLSNLTLWIVVFYILCKISLRVMLKKFSTVGG